MLFTWQPFRGEEDGLSARDVDNKKNKRKELLFLFGKVTTVEVQ